MTKLINLITERRFVEADEELSSMIPLIMEKKILEMKKATAAKMSEGIMGTIGPNRQQKLSSGVLEEDDERTNFIQKRRYDLGQKSDADSAKYDSAFKPWASLRAEYGKDSNIGKKADAYLNNLKLKKDASEKEYNDASIANMKNVENDRVINKLKDVKDTLTYTGSSKKEIQPVQNAIDSSERTKTQSVAVHTKTGFRGTVGSQNPYTKSDRQKALSQANIKENEDLNEEEQLDEARIKLVKARVRGGKVERRKKVSNVPGMTIRGGQLKRMSAAERRRRKMGARKAKMKRKAKMTRTLMKRKRSLQKRKSLGL